MHDMGVAGRLQRQADEPVLIPVHFETAYDLPGCLGGENHVSQTTRASSMWANCKPDGADAALQGCAHFYVYKPAHTPLAASTMKVPDVEHPIPADKLQSDDSKSPAGATTKADSGAIPRRKQFPSKILPGLSKQGRQSHRIAKTPQSSQQRMDRMRYRSTSDLLSRSASERKDLKSVSVQHASAKGQSRALPKSNSSTLTRQASNPFRPRKTLSEGYRFQSRKSEQFALLICHCQPRHRIL